MPPSFISLLALPLLFTGLQPSWLYLFSGSLVFALGTLHLLFALPRLEASASFRGRSFPSLRSQLKYHFLRDLSCPMFETSSIL